MSFFLSGLRCGGGGSTIGYNKAKEAVLWQQSWSMTTGRLFFRMS